jgi:hypothetical protein
MQAEAVAAAADDIAGLVGLSREDVCSVLAPAPAAPPPPPGRSGSHAADAAVRQLLLHAQRLESALLAGDWQAGQAALGGLAGGLAAVGDLCCRWALLGCVPCHSPPPQNSLCRPPTT